MNFTQYKPSTLARRIKRRMTLRGFENLEDYSRHLERNREEADALCGNCLITVTAFFREPTVFDELKKKGVSRSDRGQTGQRSHPDLGAWVRHGRGSLFDRHLPDGIPGRHESKPSVRDFRHRYQRNFDRKSARRHYKEGTISTFNIRIGTQANALKFVCEDRGPKWTGSNDGLNCVEGETVTTYGVNQGLNDREYRTRRSERPALGRHVSRRDPTAGWPVHSPREPRNGAFGDLIYTLFEDSEGNIWVGAQDGLYLLSPARFTGPTPRSRG